MISFIKNTKIHLLNSEKTYKEHLMGALINGLLLIFSGLISIIHGFFPFLFTGFTAKTIINIYYRELHNHKNKDYQKMIKEKL